MIQPAELNAAGPFAGVASAALLLFAAWWFLRLRHDQGGGAPNARPKPDLLPKESVVDGPPPLLAFAASVFVHLIVLSLLPYAGILVPEIAIRPAWAELVLIEYRVHEGVPLSAPWQWEPASRPRATDEAAAPAKVRKVARPARAADPPTEPVGSPAVQGVRDIEAARFDTVIQMIPPDPPMDPAVAEISDAPAFVLDWRAPGTRLGPAVLAEIAALNDADAMIGRFREMSEFRVRERFGLHPVSAASFAKPALAEYGPPMFRLPAPPSGGSGPRAWRPDEGGFIPLRLDGPVRGRRLAYLLSSPLMRRVNGTGVNEAAGQGGGSDSGRQDDALEANQHTPARPLERRRYGIVLVGPGAQGQIPEARGWFSGNPIYTVYLTVPGSARKWVLQFCRPGGEARRMDFSNGVIRLRPRRSLDPPYARRADPLRLDPETAGPWAKAVVFATLDDAGALSNLKIIAGPGGESGQRILASLRQWEFLPAFEDGKPVAVETVFSIPLK